MADRKADLIKSIKEILENIQKEMWETESKVLELYGLPGSGRSKENIAYLHETLVSAQEELEVAEEELEGVE